PRPDLVELRPSVRGSHRRVLHPVLLPVRRHVQDLGGRGVPVHQPVPHPLLVPMRQVQLRARVELPRLAPHPVHPERQVVQLSAHGLVLHHVVVRRSRHRPCERPLDLVVRVHPPVVVPRLDRHPVHRAEHVTAPSGRTRTPRHPDRTRTLPLVDTRGCRTCDAPVPASVPTRTSPRGGPSPSSPPPSGSASPAPDPCGGVAGSRTPGTPCPPRSATASIPRSLPGLRPRGRESSPRSGSCGCRGPGPAPRTSPRTRPASPLRA